MLQRLVRPVLAGLAVLAFSLSAAAGAIYASPGMTYDSPAAAATDNSSAGYPDMTYD
jgi:hypothetical protein